MAALCLSFIKVAYDRFFISKYGLLMPEWFSDRLVVVGMVLIMDQIGGVVAGSI